MAQVDMNQKSTPLMSEVSYPPTSTKRSVMPSSTSAKMATGLLFLLVSFFLVLWILGVPMPKGNALAICCLYILEAFALCGCPFLVDLLLKGSSWDNRYLALTVTWATVLVFGMIGTVTLLCSHNGKWDGYQTDLECWGVFLSVVGGLATTVAVVMHRTEQQNKERTAYTAAVADAETSETSALGTV